MLDIKLMPSLPHEKNTHIELREVVLTKEEEDLVLGQLHTVLRPFLLRRIKAEVLGSLPKKEERLVKCPLSALQVKLYRLLMASASSSMSSTNRKTTAAAAAGMRKGGGLVVAPSSSGTRQPTGARPISTANLVMQLRKVSTCRANYRTEGTHLQSVYMHARQSVDGICNTPFTDVNIGMQSPLPFIERSV